MVFVTDILQPQVNIQLLLREYGKACQGTQSKLGITLHLFFTSISCVAVRNTNDYGRLFGAALQPSLVLYILFWYRQSQAHIPQRQSQFQEKVGNTDPILRLKTPCMNLNLTLLCVILARRELMKVKKLH